jgi:superfamily II DNA or RNA helicase
MAGFICEERLSYGPWQALERNIARILEHGGFRGVDIVGGSGDGGADVVGTIGGDRWVVQAKFKSSGGADAAAPREAVRAMTGYSAQVAVGVTNGSFTPDAYDYWRTAKLNGIDVRLWPGAELLHLWSQLPTFSRSRRELRPYQVDAVDSVEAKRSEGGKRALVIMATGLGKTVVASEIIANELRRNPDQEVLVLAHMRDLVRQLERSSWPQLPKNCSTHLWIDGERPSYRGGVIFAGWQALQEARRVGESFENRFGVVIVDEAHHAPSTSYQDLLLHLNPNFLVGLTATPWRGDNRSLDGLFGTPVFSMDIVDGMQKGYLAEVDYRMLTDGIDWDEVAARSRLGLTIKDLNVLLLLPDRDVAMVDTIVQHIEGLDQPKAIGFCRSISHADRLKPLFAAKGLRTATLHNNLSRAERFYNLSAFRNGDIDMLLSVEMLNEGIDVPDVNLIAFMRVTHSRRIFVQQLGRGLRLSKSKSTVTVLDFVADIRRVAAVMEINREAARRASSPEVVRFADGEIVKFDNDRPVSFFNEYLADVADVENYEDGGRLRFPDFSE